VTCYLNSNGITISGKNSLITVVFVVALEWLNRLFLTPGASAVTLTNWPSSFSRGAIIFSQTRWVIMGTENKSLKNRDDRNCVSEETILKISKEIAIKFIEVGRITPATFGNTFTNIYSTINQTVRKN